MLRSKIYNYLVTNLDNVGDMAKNAMSDDLVEIMKEPLNILSDIAKQLNKWAEESKKGGWSTHQVKPQQELASKIYQYLDNNI